MTRLSMLTALVLVAAVANAQNTAAAAPGEAAATEPTVPAAEAVAAPAEALSDSPEVADAAKQRVEAPPRVLRARDTADLAPEGTWTIGVFNPLHYGLSDAIELETHPLLFLVSPNATVRVRHFQNASIRVTGEYALSVPTLGMRTLRKDLYGATLPIPLMFFPAWEGSDRDIGWYVVPSAGAAISGGQPEDHVWTVRADVALGVPIGATSANTLDSMLAPLDLLLAPALTGFRTHLGVAYDRALGRLFRLRAEVNGYVVGAPGPLFGDAEITAVALSRFYVTSHLGLDIGLGESKRLALGIYFANYDQGAREVTRDAEGFAVAERVRSNNVLPTIDFIWE